MAVELYDEHEQGERVRRWIREYGFSIVIGLALAFAGIFGYRQWQDHQVTQRFIAAEYFDVVQRQLADGNLSFAEEQFQAMQSAVPRSPQLGLASLVMASAYVEDGRLAPAAELLEVVIDDRRLSSLHPIARLRLARVREAQGDVSAALGILSGNAPVGFEAAWAELRGDLLLSRGELEAARLAYLEAMDHSGDGGMQFLLQLKIDATGPGLDEDLS